MKNNYILGLNILHGDSSACIMKNGEIIFAIEEERINRIKHWAGFPIESVKACLAYSNISLNEVQFIAINSNPFSNIFNKIKFSFSNINSYKLIINKLVLRKKKISIKSFLKENFNTNYVPKIRYFDHHLCHIASAYFPSKFKKSLLISADGFGDFASTVAGITSNEKIKIQNKILFPHSLGIFYQSFTQLLGFKNYGDEYKVMGLSAYGKNKFSDKLDKVIKYKSGSFKLNLNYFQHHKKEISMKWYNESPRFDNLYNKNLNKLFNYDFENKEIGEFHYDLARSVQNKYEEIILHYIKYYKLKNDISYLSLSGGCAMNSLANGKIIKELNFKDVYIPPAPGDAGGSIGAAILCDKKFFNNKKNYYSTPYLGGKVDNEKLEKIIETKLKISEEINLTYEKHEIDKLSKIVAHKIFENKVIGWYQNRMEWGPRALGNRSILANPCNPNMKDIINSKIKRRESFRPFAPSILKEEVKNWFELDLNVPYMSVVLKIIEEKRIKLPAVTHVDGTGRLQTVDPEKNKIFYDLIKNFSLLSGVPILLNTSFNENEPIVNNPNEAIDCFLRTKMDILVIENFIISRQS